MGTLNHLYLDYISLVSGRLTLVQFYLKDWQMFRIIKNFTKEPAGKKCLPPSLRTWVCFPAPTWQEKNKPSQILPHSLTHKCNNNNNKSLSKKQKSIWPTMKIYMFNTLTTHSRPATEQEQQWYLSDTGECFGSIFQLHLFKNSESLVSHLGWSPSGECVVKWSFVPFSSTWFLIPLWNLKINISRQFSVYLSLICLRKKGIRRV